MLDQIKQAFNKKDIINFLLLGIAVLAIPITVGSLNQQRIIKSRATNPPIQIVANPQDPEADTFQPVNNKLVLSDTNNDGIYKVYVQLEPAASLLTAGVSSPQNFFSLVKPAYAGHLHIFEDQAASYNITKRSFPQTFCDENGQNLYKELENGTHEIEEECASQGKVCAIEQTNTFASPGCFNPDTLEDLGRACNQHYDCRYFQSDDGLFPIFSDCKITPGVCSVGSCRSGSAQSPPGCTGGMCCVKIGDGRCNDIDKYNGENAENSADCRSPQLPADDCAGITKGDGTANSRCHSGNDCNTSADLTCQGPDDDCGWGRCKSTGSDTTRPSQCKSGDSCTVCGSDGACLGVEKCKGPDIGGYGRCVKPPADTAPAPDCPTTKKADNATCSKDCECQSNNCPSNTQDDSFHKCLGSGGGGTQQPVIEKFKIAQSIAGLAQAEQQTFTGAGQLVPFIFQNPNIGAENFIFVQFIGKDAQGRTTQTSPSNPAMRAAITILGPSPVITGSACNIDVDLKDGSLKFTALGSNFGTRDPARSKLLADSQQLEIKEWTEVKVVAKMANPPDTSTGKTYTITLTRADNVSATATCDVNTPQVSLEAKVFCRQPTNFEQDNVDMSVFEMVGVGTSIPGGRLSVASSSRETVRIGRNKVINNIRAKIKQGATYVVCLLAPKSVRACTDPFQAVADGNNKLANFTLPVGDLNSDCKINNVDASLLKRQWGPVNAGKNCDMNNDGKCNTFEWSCLLHDFNSSCAQEPR